ncbi:DUF4192 domain-containing protein [Gandjariella thermophila]|uniref:DUF4192 domain-containing protein n=1 Tax=Gandjariella thermophila TaxID=1931992 RepID=A0A4D4J8V8_9PSEU|nr:DUF4192 domain-containing protein [Gandjariella thermophila]GDY30303.1 hypothetical protein GTS_19360 [Gandjariella thermophila]
MTTPLRPSIRLRDAGDLIAAVPHLLGFHPIDSLVLVILHGEEAHRVGLTLRTDLPPREHHAEVVSQLLLPVDRLDATGAWLAVIGGGTADPPDLPHQDLVDLTGRALTARGIPVVHAAWVAATVAGAAWACYHPDRCCTGQVPDPASSPLAAATALAGAVTYASREELAAQLAPVDGLALARRSARLELAAEAAELDRRLAGPAAVVRDLVAVHQAITDMASGRLVLGDEEVVRLAVALADHRVRDACLATADGPHAAAAEQLWLALTRGTPVPERAEPATLLAFAAYLRGDGALAGIALDTAEAAHPGHRLAGLLRRALDAGLPPARLAVLAADAAADAERLIEAGESR